MSKRPSSSHANVSESDIEIKRQKEDQVVLNVLLNCELTKSSEIKQVHFQSLPTTPLEIKKKIEEDFSIPSCVQTLHYQSMILKDSDQLQHTHFRSGDTFTVDYPAEAECDMIQNVLKWLKELYDLLKCVDGRRLSPDEEENLLFFQKIENLIVEGDENDIIEAVSLSLFYPYGDKEKLMNSFYFRQEGGIDMLVELYAIVVSKEWGQLGIDNRLHIYLEGKCSQAIHNYAETVPLCRQVVQLGGLETCTKALLRRQLWGSGDDGTLDNLVYMALRNAAILLNSLSELPECQVPLAKRTDVIDQTLAMALHPAYDCSTAKFSVETILNLTQSPETHPYITRREVVEKMLEICERRHKTLDQLSPRFS